MQKTSNLAIKSIHVQPFYEDIAILLDIYQDGDTLTDMLPKIQKTSCSPTSSAYPLEWVASEILQPQVLELGSALMLKKLCHFLPVKNFRQIIRCFAVLSNETLKNFMVSVVFNLKNSGFTALTAKQVYDFSLSTLNKSASSGKHLNDSSYNSSQKVDGECYDQEAIQLTKTLLNTLHEHKIIRPAKANQNSRMLAYSFDQLDLYDTTVVFLMHWLRDRGYAGDDVINHRMWSYLGMDRKALVQRLYSAPLDNFFLSANEMYPKLVYKYNNTNEALNRLKLIST